jgi:hypothetical protein
MDTTTNNKTGRHGPAFTPGPWFTGDDHPSVCTMRDGESIQLCAMDTTPFALGEPEANARLIAAAPELLEACRGLLAVVAVGDGWKNPYEQGTQSYAAIEAARAAIAKATGEGVV